MKILVDPGHGGNTGARSKTGLIEDAITLSIGTKLYDPLSGLGHHVQYTRLDASYISWVERAYKCSEFDPDLVLCLHCDSRPGDGRGSIIFSRSEYTIAMIPFAEKFIDTLGRERIYTKNGIQKPMLDVITTVQPLPHWSGRAHFCLRHYAKNPGVLIEIGCLSEDSEAEFMASDDGQEKIIQSILSALQTIAS